MILNIWNLILSIHCVNLNLGSLPKKLNHLKLTISHKVNISIISSKLHTIEIQIDKEKNRNYIFGKKWVNGVFMYNDELPMMQRDYNEFVSNIGKISKELNPNFTRLILPCYFGELIPDFITELYIKEFNSKPDNIIKLPIFNPAKDLDNIIVFIEKNKRRKSGYFQPNGCDCQFILSNLSGFS